MLSCGFRRCINDLVEHIHGGGQTVQRLIFTIHSQSEVCITNRGLQSQLSHAVGCELEGQLLAGVQVQLVLGAAGQQVLCVAITVGNSFVGDNRWGAIQVIIYLFADGNGLAFCGGYGLMGNHIFKGDSGYLNGLVLSANVLFRLGFDNLELRNRIIFILQNTESDRKSVV